MRWEKEIKDIQIGKEKIKQFLFINDMNVYVENIYDLDEFLKQRTNK